MIGTTREDARVDIHRCISASQACQAACEAALEHLAAQGLRADGELMRLLRQCAEQSGLLTRVLQKQSRLTRHTALVCWELCTRVAGAAWPEVEPPREVLAHRAQQLAEACQPLLKAA